MVETNSNLHPRAAGGILNRRQLIGASRTGLFDENVLAGGGGGGGYHGKRAVDGGDDDEIDVVPFDYVLPIRDRRHVAEGACQGRGAIREGVGAGDQTAIW